MLNTIFSSRDPYMENLRHTLDAASIFAAIGTFFSWMPNVAALLSVVWLSTRLYEYFKAKYNNRSVKNIHE